MGNSDKPDLPQHAAHVIEQRSLATCDTPVLLMVSGGSDSTALAYVADDLRHTGVLGKVAILHVNHKLRGQDADDDARFVEQLATMLDMPFFLYEADVAQEAENTGENLEAVARRARYQAAEKTLDKMCRDAGIPASDGRIFTAHTADDRVESFYMRSIVGTGPGGFRAMRYRNGSVARPLMDESRESLRDYLNTRADASEPVVRDKDGALWREDETNAHTDRFRAYVRHEIVPHAKQWNERALDVLVRSMNLIADEDDMLDDMAADLASRCVQWIDTGTGEHHDTSQDTGNTLQPDSGQKPDPAGGCILSPDFGEEPRPLQRRVVMQLLEQLLGSDERVETASIEAVLDGFEDGRPQSGYVINIQGNLAVSANKRGVRIEPMASFRARRKRG